MKYQIKIFLILISLPLSAFARLKILSETEKIHFFDGLIEFECVDKTQEYDTAKFKFEWNIKVSEIVFGNIKTDIKFETAEFHQPSIEPGKRYLAYVRYDSSSMAYHSNLLSYSEIKNGKVYWNKQFYKFQIWAVGRDTIDVSKIKKRVKIYYLNTGHK